MKTTTALFLVLMTMASCSLTAPGTLVAQDFDEWMRRQQQQYEDFRAEQNRAFADMLRRQWQAMQGEAPEAQYEEEKPVEPPVADTGDIRPEEEPDKEVTPPPPPSPPSPPPPEKDPVPETRTEPAVPERKPTPEIHPPDTDPAQPSVTVNFYGLTLEIPYDPSLSALAIPDTYDAETITDTWEALSDTDIESVVSYYEKIQELYMINDWGLARLIFSTGKAIFEGNPDHARLYTWFMLIQNGLQSRIGFNEDGIRLMIASESHIYGTPFFRFNGVPFFLAYFDKLPSEPGRLYSYRDDFPAELRPLSLDIPASPVLTPDQVRRRLSFEFKGETINLEVDVNQSQISYYEYYPQTELAVYFHAPVKSSTASDLIGELSGHLEGRPEQEAIHLLLRFVQTAFGYKIDPENFGREKPLFPEETLFYDYSDCEDRAVLFSFLVRELTGLDVVGLRYPGHIATAVRFNEDIPGDTVEVDGDTYHVCDPTYIHAGPGMAMDRFKNISPEIIPIKR